MRYVVIGLTILFLAWLTSGAHAATCTDRDLIIRNLEEDYGESLANAGLSEDRGSVVVQYVNIETGTWTALVIYPDGQACVVASGHDWTSFTTQGNPT